MRVTIPTNADELIKLAQAIKTKHDALGAASPLNGIEGIEQFGPQTDTAEAKNESAKAHARAAETDIQNRDRALGQSGQLTPGTVRFFVNSARDILLALNKGKEKNLGDWSFTVDDSPQAKAKPTPPAP